MDNSISVQSVFDGAAAWQGWQGGMFLVAGIAQQFPLPTAMHRSPVGITS